MIKCCIQNLILYSVLFLSCTQTETVSSGTDNPINPTSNNLILNFVSTINDSAVAALWTVSTVYGNGCYDVCNQNLISNESRSAFHITVDFSQTCGVDGVCEMSPPSYVTYSVTKSGYMKINGSVPVTQNDKSKTVIVKLNPK